MRFAEDSLTAVRKFCPDFLGRVLPQSILKALRIQHGTKIHPMISVLDHEIVPQETLIYSSDIVSGSMLLLVKLSTCSSQSRGELKVEFESRLMLGSAGASLYMLGITQIVSCRHLVHLDPGDVSLEL